MANNEAIEVTLGSLDGPSDRFTWIGNDIRTTLHDTAGSQTDAAAAAASNADVTAGCEDFKAAVQAALLAFGVDAEVLGLNVGKAKVQYATSDAKAKVDVTLPLIPGLPDPELPTDHDQSSSGAFAD